jgi:hypothetical protein
MKGLRVVFLCLTSFVCYIQAKSVVADGTLLNDGYHYKKSNSNSNSNSYSQSNDQKEEIDGVINGRAFKGEKKTGYSTSGASHTQSSSYSSSSFTSNVPTGALTELSSGSDSNEGLQSNIAFEAATNPGTGYLNIEHLSASNNNPSKQESGTSESQVNQTYWWLSENSPFKPQGGCTSKHCSVSGTFPLSNGVGAVANAYADGSSTGSAAIIQNAGPVGSTNPFLNPQQAKDGKTHIGGSIIASAGHYGSHGVSNNQNGALSSNQNTINANYGSNSGFENQVNIGQIGYNNQNQFGLQAGSTLSNHGGLIAHKVTILMEEILQGLRILQRTLDMDLLSLIRILMVEIFNLGIKAVSKAPVMDKSEDKLYLVLKIN